MVVPPAYNEAENVTAVVSAIPASSTATTWCRSSSRERRPRTRRRSSRARPARSWPSFPSAAAGAWRCASGYEIALQLDADIVVTMDADGQHRPEELPVMVAPILDGRADYVNGSRLLGDFERSARSATSACTSSPGS